MSLIVMYAFAEIYCKDVEDTLYVPIAPGANPIEGVTIFPLTKGPIAPWDPCAPVAPVFPCAPVEPVSPRGPVEPIGPTNV